MTGGWWRRNAISLAAIAVLLPVTVGVIAVNEWSEQGVPIGSGPIVVEPGAVVSYGGARVGPAKATFTDDPAAPSGARVVSTTVLVSPDDGPIRCLSPVLRELEGTGRQWDEASSELDRDFAADRRTFCDSERSIRYSLTLDYLVPSDATGPFTVDLEVLDAATPPVRLIVEP
ncbi:MAG TPA: hypothetical protein VNP97_12720 [Microbacterium sp.]|nr:hypothetical protein [Microbacterium sp.]